MADDIILEKEVVSDYELERGKPMPRFIHGFIEANLTVALREQYRKARTVTVEVTVNLSDL